MAEGLHVLVIMGWVVFWCIAIVVALWVLYLLYLVGRIAYAALSECGPIERACKGLLVVVAAWLLWAHVIRPTLFGMPRR